MSQTKAQLVAPIGVVTAGGIVASGVVTASTLDGNITGSATSIIQGKNLNVGIISATDFAGDFSGTATGIITSSAIKVGSFTATSFVGDFTGTATSMFKGTGFTAGAVNATSFEADVTGNVTGNATGIAGTVIQGTNIHVGVITATSLHGDGSSLSGIAATNFTTQTVSGIGTATSIDLSAGNMVKFNQSTSTTVSFANTSTAMDVNIFHTTDGSYDISYSTGGVDFNGSSEYTATGANATLAPGTNDFTIEAWINPDSWATNEGFYQTDSGGLELYATTNYFGVKAQGGSLLCEANSRPEVDTWTHVAVSRSGTSLKIFFNGTEVGSATDSTDFTATGSTYIGAGTGYFDGTVSNLRLVVGTAVYTDSFVPPSAALTNIDNTKLLCCQSTTDNTAAAVLSGTTLSGSGTAGSHTVAASGVVSLLNNTLTWPSTVKWTGGSAPTINFTDTSEQQIQLLTRDGGLTWYGWEVYNDEKVNYEYWGWGYTIYGDLGNNIGGGNPARRSSPVQVAGTTYRNLFHSGAVLAVHNDNTMWAWGYNDYGGLAQNDITQRSSPVQIPGTTWRTIDSLANIAALSIQTAGTLWAWGMNQYGTLGLNQATSVNLSSPTQVGTETTWNVAKCGTSTAAAIKTDGSLWSWGKNQRGELGQNNEDGHTSSPKQVGTDTDWSDLGPGREHFLAVKTDGTLWSWGYNSYGTLGLNDRTQYSSPMQVGTDTTWEATKISSKGNYDFGIKTDGTMWTWGYNGHGELGQNNRTNYSSPTQIPGSWASVSPTGEHVLATKSDKTLWFWGNDEQGQSGLNNLTKYSSPTQIGTTTGWTVQDVYIYGKISSALKEF